MRFSLAHLLLVFPAFFLATLACTFWLMSGCSYYTFHAGYVGVRQVQRHVAHVKSFDETDRLSLEVINQWLAGELPANYPGALRFYEHPGTDPWGNPYKAVRIARVDEHQIESIGVFSTGRDGVSNSGGNDPDDLNSWDPNCDQWYVSDTAWRNRAVSAIGGAILTPFFYLLLLSCGRGLRRLNQPRY